ncbi:MAG: hypothetical protein ACK54X_06010 [Burkholderiales bacterium]
MREHRAAGAAAAQRARRAHRLDLAVPRVVQFLQRAAAEQQVAVAHRPEGDRGDLQATDVERVHALRGRLRVHVAQVLLEQRGDVGGGGVVELDALGVSPA